MPPKPHSSPKFWRKSRFCLVSPAPAASSVITTQEISSASSSSCKSSTQRRPAPRSHHLSRGTAGWGPPTSFVFQSLTEPGPYGTAPATSQLIPLGILHPQKKATNPFLGCQTILQQAGGSVELTDLQTLLDKSVLRHFKKHSAFWGQEKAV